MGANEENFFGFWIPLSNLVPSYACKHSESFVNNLSSRDSSKR